MKFWNKFILQNGKFFSIVHLKRALESKEDLPV